MQAAESRAAAESLRARGEHRRLLPSVDFAAQYALLAEYNNYQDFFQPGSFQRHNATVGVVHKISALQSRRSAPVPTQPTPWLSKAKRDAETAKNQVSEETLRLQRSVEQMAAAKEVADLEYQVAQSNLESLRRALDAGSVCLA